MVSLFVIKTRGRSKTKANVITNLASLDEVSVQIFWNRNRIINLWFENLFEKFQARDGHLITLPSLWSDYKMYTITTPHE